ncbi:Copper resistance protein CRF1 [Cytospora mali]|uniref:Copper resistance protein CRF1 n=1 Tax=Cytospora mali TaxID=578113 RepID=A0A194VZG3_CYTMA|nr:Copper resistance protein CRF1 [Valsa mali]
MIIDGEKWACESCVRGHRVSNCQHAERPLQHINKKGRPVSQCQHCRSMRRSKSAHVKCDCGEKTSKCVHLQATVEGHRESCCCNHGGRCTCSHKKEQNQLDTVPESDSENETSSSSNAKVSKAVRIRRRSRASTQNSDGMLTFDENGHHKPTYKHTKASQKSGPYQLTRGHSNQSTGSTGNRSMDDLDNSSSTSSSASMPQAQEQRLSRSESASPLMTGTSSLAQSTGQLPRLDLSNVTGWAPSFVADSFDLFGASLDDHEQPIFSAGLNQPSVDWSHYGLDFASKDMGSFAPSSYSQAQSFAGFDQPPTLTSGEVSEVEDFIPSTGDEFDPIGTFSRTNTSSTGFSLAPSQESLMGAIEMNGTDFDFAKINKEDGAKFAASATALVGEDSAMAAAVASSGVAGFENDPIFWMGEVDYSGLTAVNDVPDANVPNFWDVQ